MYGVMYGKMNYIYTLEIYEKISAQFAKNLIYYKFFAILLNIS